MEWILFLSMCTMYLCCSYRCIVLFVWQFYKRWIGRKMLLSVLILFLMGTTVVALSLYLCLNFAGQYIDSILSGFGTLVGAIIAIGGYIIKSQENALKNALRYTTESREKWMDKGRQSASQLVGLINNYHDLYRRSFINDMNQLINLHSQIQKTIMQLKLHFNFAGDRDRAILGIIDCISRDIDVLNKQIIKYYSYDKQHSKVVDHTKMLMRFLELHLQAYYKVEWERIKMESIFSGNLETRDEYIKLAMIDEREKCYLEQFKRENKIFTPKELKEYFPISICSLLYNFNKSYFDKHFKSGEEPSYNQIKNIIENEFIKKHTEDLVFKLYRKTEDKAALLDFKSF